MSDYFDRVEHELRLAAGRQAAPAVRRPRFRVRLDGLAVGLSVGVAVLIAVLALSLRHHAPHPSASTGHGPPDLSVQKHIGPTLHELLANFAVLRRPPTAAEHALIGRFTVGTNHKPSVPEYIRLAGTAAGVRVYFLIYPVFQHGSTGPVVAHEMNLAAGNSGYAYVPGSYFIFPTVIGGFSHPAAYLGVAPDGVRAVRWQFACRPSFPGCRLPSERAATVTVHNNLAVLPLPALGSGTGYAPATKVTWYRTNGSRTLFRNQNAAVPFAGAPAWPTAHRAKKH